jgi:hypothetical protein
MVSDVSNILSSISILLVFITVFVDLNSKEVGTLISSKLPLPHEDSYTSELINSFKKSIIKSLFLMIFSISIVYSIMPVIVDIIMSSKISLWYFDIQNTLFILMFIGIVALAFISLSSCVSIIKRYIEIKKAT